MPRDALLVANRAKSLAANVDFLFNGGSRIVIILSFKNALYANPISLNDAEFFWRKAVLPAPTFKSMPMNKQKISPKR